MAKFYGEVGFAQPVVIRPGVHDEEIVAHNYYGDVIRVSRSLQDGSKVNSDITVGNSISIVADAYANEHFFAMRYVKWAGVYWTVEKVDVLAPRLNLQLGGVYNGPKASTPESP